MQETITIVINNKNSYHNILYGVNDAKENELRCKYLIFGTQICEYPHLLSYH